MTQMAMPNKNIKKMRGKVKKIALIEPIRNFSPNMGLITLAAIPKLAGKEVKILYMFDYEYKSGDQLSNYSLKKIKDFDPDIIGVGFLSAEWHAAKVVIERLATAFDKIIVAGGRHPSSFPKDVLTWGADFVIVGEGETAFEELINCIENNGAGLESSVGIAFYKEDGAFHLNPRLKETANLDIIPAYHLIPYQNFINTKLGVVGRYLKSGWLATSRGCFSKCIYCRDNNFGGHLRFRSMDAVFDDIRLQLSNYDLDCFYIVDDMFAVKEKRVIEFCDRFIAIQKEFNKMLYFAATARTDTLTKPMVNAMEKAGCTQLTFGVESGSPKIHDILNTNKSCTTIVPAFEMLKESEIDTFVNFIIGVPGENEDDINLTLKIIDSIKPTTVGVTFLTPYPGTRLYDLACNNNWLDGDMKKEFVYRHNYKPQLNVGIDPSLLLNRAKRIYKKTSRKTILNVFTRHESIELIFDVIKMMFKHPVKVLDTIKSILTGDIDKFKTKYRHLLYVNTGLTINNGL
ncbi:MAG: radical SAM protein [Candidatus Omnitrophota bacterium]